MGEMVKRLARAICASYGDEYDEQPADFAALEALRRRENGSRYDGVHPHDPGFPTQVDWDECARAALQAIREPTEQMILAAMITSYPTVEQAGGLIQQARAAVRLEWQAMVEAALSEG